MWEAVVSCAVYDPMTLLTFDQMNELVDWWRAGGPPSGEDEIELENQSISGGGFKVMVDPGSGVWITPTPE